MSLQDEVDNLAEQLGISFDWNADDDLSKYRKGKPLLLKELKAMPDGSVVWATFRKDNESELRIDGAFRIKRVSNNEWMLDDGSSFASDFTPWSGCKDNDQCEEDTSRGPLYLWKANG